MSSHDERRQTPTVTTVTPAEVARLPKIERELASHGVRLRFHDQSLEQDYRASQQAAGRLQMRVTVILLTLIYDAFVFPEAAKMPEALALSATLRFALLTPASLLFVLLGWRGRLTSRQSLAGAALLVVPTLVSTLESLQVTSGAALRNFGATPFLQLAVLTSGVSPVQAFAVNLANNLLFACIALNRTVVPAAEASLLMLVSLSIGVATVLFAWRIDVRDRQVFLFRLQAAIGREVLAEQNHALARLSQVDALTGLGNRRCFDQTLAALWEAGRAGGLTVSLVMLDVDCFKPFNDLLGHQAGDECLGAVARVVRSCLRDEHDTLVRYGGEEFAIVLPHTSLEEGVAVAERVRQAVLDRALPHPGAPLRLVSVSLGVAMVSTAAQTAASLIEAADQCLYAAKRGGRNQVVSGAARRDFALVADMAPPVARTG